MSKSRVAFVTAGTTIIILVLSQFLLVKPQSEDSPPVESAQETTASSGLGITYLPCTPGLADYYDLEVDSGALVTEVVPHSPADEAGIKVGDVILSFNGVKVGENISLLGMMRACSAGNRIALEIWREKKISIIELLHRHD